MEGEGKVSTGIAWHKGGGYTCKARERKKRGEGGEEGPRHKILTYFI